MSSPGCNHFLLVPRPPTRPPSDMLEYEKFVQKMIALNLHEILPYVAETVQYNFYLYSAIHWMEVSLTIEALHQGLISLGVSPKDARTKSLKMFQDLLPLRIEDAKKRFLASCGDPVGKGAKSRISSIKIHSQNPTNDSPNPMKVCSHAFDTLDELLTFSREKASELSTSSCKENKTEPPPPSEPTVLSHLVDDVFVVRDPQRLLQKVSSRSSLDSAVKAENKKLRRLVNKLEAELTKQSLT